ncbi:hypothetical protein J7J41_02410 [bacterium]|nr:hypothetical protein [bacterium]
MVDATPVVIDGWKTDANHYIKIYTPETARHNGTVSQGFKIKANAHWIDVVEINDIGNDGYIYIEGLIIDVGTYAATGLALNVPSDKSCSAYFSKNIIYSSDPSNSHSHAKGIVVGESGYYGHLYAWDNLIYDIQNGTGMKFNSWNPAHAYNNTVYNCNIGIDAGGGSSNDLLKNNLCNGNNTDYRGTFSSNSVNNISEDDTSPNADYRNKAVSFIDKANDDFHLAPNDICAKDSGIDLSPDPDLSFTDDIDGDTRSGTWDIGADERGESTFLVGDLNQDNKVDSKDFQILIQKFRQTQDIKNEDLNSDGIVDAKDVGILMHYWTN